MSYPTSETNSKLPIITRLNDRPHVATINYVRACHPTVVAGEARSLRETKRPATANAHRGTKSASTAVFGGDTHLRGDCNAFITLRSTGEQRGIFQGL